MKNSLKSTMLGSTKISKVSIEFIDTSSEFIVLYSTSKAFLVFPNAFNYKERSLFVLFKDKCNFIIKNLIINIMKNTPHFYDIL